MGYVDLSGVGYKLPDGRMLFADVTFRVGEGAKVALVGPNGAGKTTLLRLVAGDTTASAGSIARGGGLGVMRQFIGMIGDETTLGQLALSLCAPRVREVGQRRLVADHADELAHHAEPADACHRALAQRQVPGDQPQQRGLARAVRPDERDLRALADPERDVGEQHSSVREHMPHPGDVDVAHGCGFSPGARAMSRAFRPPARHPNVGSKTFQHFCNIFSLFDQYIAIIRSKYYPLSSHDYQGSHEGS